MNCPQCSNVALVMSERQGVEIDYCPQCRGVWLDRGELDKIVERSNRMDEQRYRGRDDDEVAHEARSLNQRAAVCVRSAALAGSGFDSNTCRVLPSSVVQAPGAGLHPRMRL